MITRYNTKELINSNLFIKEPVHKILEQLKNNNKKTIILTGGRGIGKSVVLQTHELKNNHTKDKSIYMSFSGIGILSTPYTKEFLEHYYELVMSYNILNYLKRTHEVTYENNFKEIENYLSEINIDTNNYMRHCGYRKINLNKKLKFGEVTTKIIKEIRKNYNINSLTLLIDRFDWTNARDEVTQTILQRYFHLFNKVIITTDSQINNEELDKKGYSIFEINYNKKIDVIKKIIEAQVKLHNETTEYDMFLINSVSDEIYEKLIHETNGNISSILSVFEKAYILSKWSKNEQLDKIIIDSLEDVKDKEKAYQKMVKPPKLYL